MHRNYKLSLKAFVNQLKVFLQSNPYEESVVEYLQQSYTDAFNIGMEDVDNRFLSNASNLLNKASQKYRVPSALMDSWTTLLADNVCAKKFIMWDAHSLSLFANGCHWQRLDKKLASSLLDFLCEQAKTSLHHQRSWPRQSIALFLNGTRMMRLPQSLYQRFAQDTVKSSPAYEERWFQHMSLIVNGIRWEQLPPNQAKEYQTRIAEWLCEYLDSSRQGVNVSQLMMISKGFVWEQLDKDLLQELQNYMLSHFIRIPEFKNTQFFELAEFSRHIFWRSLEPKYVRDAQIILLKKAFAQYKSAGVNALAALLSSFEWSVFSNERASDYREKLNSMLIEQLRNEKYSLAPNTSVMLYHSCISAEYSWREYPKLYDAVITAVVDSLQSKWEPKYLHRLLRFNDAINPTSRRLINAVLDNLYHFDSEYSWDPVTFCQLIINLQLRDNTSSLLGFIIKKLTKIFQENRQDFNIDLCAKLARSIPWRDSHRSSLFLQKMIFQAFIENMPKTLNSDDMIAVVKCFAGLDFIHLEARVTISYPDSGIHSMQDALSAIVSTWLDGLDNLRRFDELRNYLGLMLTFVRLDMLDPDVSERFCKTIARKMKRSLEERPEKWSARTLRLVDEWVVASHESGFNSHDFSRVRELIKISMTQLVNSAHLSSDDCSDLADYFIQCGDNDIAKQLLEHKSLPNTNLDDVIDLHNLYPTPGEAAVRLFNELNRKRNKPIESVTVATGWGAHNFTGKTGVSVARFSQFFQAEGYNVSSVEGNQGRLMIEPKKRKLHEREKPSKRQHIEVKNAP